MSRRYLVIDLIAAFIVIAGIAGVAFVVLDGGNKGPAATPFPVQQLTQAPTPMPTSSSPAAQLALGNWPTYGYDLARTRFNPAIALRPPFKVRWEFHAHDLLEFPPSIYRNDLYFCTEHGFVYCLDATTKRVLWTYRLRAKFASTPTVDGTTVYVTSIGGRLVVLDRLTGHVLWQIAGLGPIESSALVWRGRVFFGSLDDHVYAVDIKSHRIVWRYRTGGPVKGSVSELNGRLVIGSYDGSVYCLGYNGGLVWRHAIGGLISSNQFYATASLAYNTAYIGGTGGGIYAFDLSNGGQRWSFTTGGYVYSSPAIWRNLVFEGSYDGYFYALNAASGKLVWRFYAQGPVSGSPTVLDGIVYVSSFARRTWGLDARTGHVVWRFHDGRYSPVTADRQTLYLNGAHTLYALVPKK